MRGFRSQSFYLAVLVVLCWSSLTVAQSPGFGSMTNFEVGNNPRAIVVGDFNRDGFIDLAVANLDSNSITILLGRGDGTCNRGSDLTVGTAPRAIVVADFNGDNVADLAVANSGS